MNRLVAITGSPIPSLVATAGNKASTRFLEFFASNIRNPNTRRAYLRAVQAFFSTCSANGITDLADIEPLHVSFFIEQISREVSAPSVKQQLAAVRHLFDWMVVGQIVPTNPASSVKGPTYTVRKGKTPILDGDEARQFLESIDTSTVVGLRDRALIAMMVYTFCRIGAATSMKVQDVFVQRRRLYVRLHEKGGKEHEMPCHHVLEKYLQAYIEGACLKYDPSLPLFRTIGRGTKELTKNPLPQANAYAMVERRRIAAGIQTKIGNHSCRGTGITTYLKNGGTLENAAYMANHASTRTTQLYDRRHDEITLDEVERIRL